MAISVTFGRPLAYHHPSIDALIISSLTMGSSVTEGSDKVTVPNTSALRRASENGAIVHVHKDNSNYWYFQCSGVAVTSTNIELSFNAINKVGSISSGNTVSLYFYEPSDEIIQCTVTLSGGTVEVLQPSNIYIEPRSASHQDNITSIQKTAYYHADNRFNLLFQISDFDKSGFKARLYGTVYDKSSHTEDTLSATSHNFTYDTRTPVIENIEIPATYSPNLIFDVIFQFNRDVNFRNPQRVFSADTATYLDFFEFEGVENFGQQQPELFKKTDNNFPTTQVGAGTGVSPPSGWVQVSQEVSRGQIYMLRWQKVNAAAAGLFQLHLRENAVIGELT